MNSHKIEILNRDLPPDVIAILRKECDAKGKNRNMAVKNLIKRHIKGAYAKKKGYQSK